MTEKGVSYKWQHVFTTQMLVYTEIEGKRGKIKAISQKSVCASKLAFSSYLAVLQYLT